MILAGDINAYSFMWNPHYHQKQNVSILEEIIDQYHLLVNNKPGRATWPSSQEILVIDLALFTVELGPLTLWKFQKSILHYPIMS